MKLKLTISLLISFLPFLAAAEGSGDLLSSRLNQLSLIDSRAATFDVIDSSNGLPVKGALVRAEDSEFEATTDENGLALLQFPAHYRSVTVTAPGYQPLSVLVKNNTLITVNLIPVIETATQRPATRVTNRVAELMGNIYSIDRPGAPGNGAAIFIDGLHSLNSSSQPLYIVDGQPWQGNAVANNLFTGYGTSPLSMLDPKNIKSIKVLRDGSALYGPKGGNGVVIITTKRAKDTADGLHADVSVGVRTAPERIDLPPMSSLNHTGGTVTDWVGMVTQNAFVSDVGLNYTGGPQWGRLRASLNYNHEDGALRLTGTDRLSARLNSDFKILENLTAKLDLTVAHHAGELFTDGLNAHSSPYFIAHLKAPWQSPWTGGSLSDTDPYGVGNPLAIMQLGYGHLRRNQFTLNVEPEWKIDNRWTVTARIGYILKRDNLNKFVPDLGTTDDEILSPDGTSSTIMKQRVTDATNHRTTFTTDIHATFTPWARGDHKLTATAGGRWQNDTWTIDNRQGFNTGSDELKDINDTDPAFLRLKQHYLRWRSLGGYATARYSWLRRYFLNVTGVIEGSSRFGSRAPGAIHVGGVSWGVFPSVSASWLLSEEDFFQPVDIINKLKVNLSYTVTGNDNLPLTAASTFFTSQGILKNDNIFQLARNSNEKLKWETSATLRGGVDVGLFSDRITASVDIFMANVFNLMLYRAESNKPVGNIVRWYNGGSMRNIGFTFSASSRLINTARLSLDIGVMVGGYRNLITSLDNGSFVTDISGAQVLTAVGYPVGTFYGFKGDDTTQLYSIGNPNPDAYGNITAALKYGRWSFNTLFTWTAGNDIYNGLRAAVEHQYGDHYLNGAPQQSTPFRFNDSMIEDGSYFKLKRLSVDYRLPLKWSFLKELTLMFTATNLFTISGYSGADPETFGGATPMELGIDDGLLPISRSFHLGVSIPL